MNHKEKVKLARRLYTKDDKYLKRTIFTSIAWLERRRAIALEVIHREEKSRNPSLF